MQFPFVIEVGPLRLPVHAALEFTAYAVGFQVFRWCRRRQRDQLSPQTRLVTIAGAAVGAMVGSRFVSWMQHPGEFLTRWNDPALWLTGKSIVGGLLGGMLGVEWMKRAIGETRSTGDLFVLPLCVGIAIGRIGCFLSGLEDGTYGIATTLPWGVDFGDGIRRHPTQLYEVVFLASVAIWAARRWRRISRSGDLFRGFMVLYLAWRLVIDCWKPDPRPYLGLSGIQVVCLAGLGYYARGIRRVFLATGGPDHG